MNLEISSPAGVALVVDDDADVLKAASLLLAQRGLRVLTARSPTEAWSVLASEPIDVILLDLNFSRASTTGEEGLHVLEELVRQCPGVAVVVITGHSGISVAVAAMRAGAVDFVMKPWNNERLAGTVMGAVELSRARRSSTSAGRGGMVVHFESNDEALILGNSASIERVRDLIRRIAPAEAPVMIFGERGVGKALVARALHRQSHRAGGSLIAIDLSAPEEVVESALFGETAEAAHGGTLFLDEIGALTPTLQARLLAVLHEPRSVLRDVRLVSASARSQQELQRLLRPDLLDLLDTLIITVPALRERAEDTVLLAEHFLRVFTRRHGRPAKPLTSEAIAAVAAAPWSGNVRELRQAIERAVILTEGDCYTAGDLLPLASAEPPPQHAPALPTLNLARSERTLVVEALKRHSFNVSRAAKDLGVTRAALYRRMAKHGV